MSFNNIKFTNKGRNLHAKVQAGATLNFTRIAIGDGDNGGASSDEYDSLLNQVHNINITKLKSTSDGTAIVGGIFNNSGLPAFYLREIGLFATDLDLGEILYCYGNAGANAEHIPEGGGSTILERQLDIIVIIGNATNLTANIDYSMYATMEFVQDEVAAHDADETSHNDIRQKIIDLTATDIAYDNVASEMTAEDVQAAIEELRTQNNTLDALLGLGGVAESGTNENGSYIKFEDGTMICFGTITAEMTSTNAMTNGGGYRTGGNTKPYPATFVSNPQVICTNSDITSSIAVGLGNIQQTQFQVVWYTVTSDSTARSRSARYLAIGRWK